MQKDLYTERLILRELRESDAEAIFKWASDPEVTRFLTWNPHSSIEVTKTILALWLKDYADENCYRYGIELKDTGDLIGMIDVVGYHHGNPVVGYVLNRDYWNNGYMTEAFNAFKNMLLEKYDTIVIEAAKDNIGSNKVIQKNGFRYVYTETRSTKGEEIEINGYRYLKGGVGRMRVLIINGSGRTNGCTARALKEVADALQADGIEVNTFNIGNQAIRGCISCHSCRQTGKCVFNDAVNEIAPYFEDADGIVVGTPVYYAHANGNVISFLDRLFFSTRFDKKMKVGAAVVSSRRAGSTSAFDEINKYFTISQMPIVSSNYWNEVHGFKAEDVEKDIEGLRTLRNLGHNMAFLLKAIKLGRLEFGYPETEKGPSTSFTDGL